jgi:hypothetical protein
LLNAICVSRFSLQLLSETFFILIRNERDMIQLYVGLHVKYPFIHEEINQQNALI